jgi:hypothetical protein
MSLAGIGLALTAASALGQIRQGQAQAAGLRARGQGLLVQADFERLRGRQEALKSKREAVNQLQGILEALARTTAVAGAGNIDPFSGNPEGIKIKALDVGGLNVVVARENAAITRLVANFQASQFEFAAGQAFAAASAAKSAGMTNALLTLGTGAFFFGQAGGFGNLFKGATATTATGGGAISATAGSTLRPMLPSPGTFTQSFQFPGFGTSAPNAAGTIGI